MLLVSYYILEKASASRNVTLVQLRSCRAEKQALASRGTDYELGAACRDRRKEFAIQGSSENPIYISEG